MKRIGYLCRLNYLSVTYVTHPLPHPLLLFIIGRKKKKITYTASLAGVEKAETALLRLGFEDAILSFANLSFVNLKGVRVKNARFGWNKGISQNMKLDLELQGAIFEDFPGERSGILIDR